MTYCIFLFGSSLGEGLVPAQRLEQRIVAEAARAMLFCEDGALDAAIEVARSIVSDKQGYCGAEPGTTVGYAVELAQQSGIVGGTVVPLAAGIACAVYARRYHM